MKSIVIISAPRTSAMQKQLTAYDEVGISWHIQAQSVHNISTRHYDWAVLSMIDWEAQYCHHGRIATSLGLRAANLSCDTIALLDTSAPKSA